MMMAPKTTAVIGYTRVSTDGQSLDAQRAALKAAGATRIFSEKQSGVVTARKELAKAMAALGAGDVLVVTRLDRLARSTRDLLNTIHAVAEKKAAFKSIGDAWADTTTSHGKLMLTVLGGLAEFERDLIRTRTGEGRKRALAAGVRFGRKPKLTPHQAKEALARIDGGESQPSVARSYNVDQSTISRLRERLTYRPGDLVLLNPECAPVPGPSRRRSGAVRPSGPPNRPPG
jgi:DNA invertase Pin-like site-specific DNA recombinase